MSNGRNPTPTSPESGDFLSPDVAQFFNLLKQSKKYSDDQFQSIYDQVVAFHRSSSVREIADMLMNLQGGLALEPDAADAIVAEAMRFAKNSLIYPPIPSSPPTQESVTEEVEEVETPAQNIFSRIWRFRSRMHARLNQRIVEHLPDGPWGNGILPPEMQREADDIVFGNLEEEERPCNTNERKKAMDEQKKDILTELAGMGDEDIVDMSRTIDQFNACYSAVQQYVAALQEYLTLTTWEKWTTENEEQLEHRFKTMGDAIGRFLETCNLYVDPNKQIEVVRGRDDEAWLMKIAFLRASDPAAADQLAAAGQGKKSKTQKQRVSIVDHPREFEELEKRVKWLQNVTAHLSSYGEMWKNFLARIVPLGQPWASVSGGGGVTGGRRQSRLDAMQKLTDEFNLLGQHIEARRTGGEWNDAKIKEIREGIKKSKMRRTKQILEAATSSRRRLWITAGAGGIISGKVLWPIVVTTVSAINGALNPFWSDDSSEFIDNRPAVKTAEEMAKEEEGILQRWLGSSDSEHEQDAQNAMDEFFKNTK